MSDVRKKRGVRVEVVWFWGCGMFGDWWCGCCGGAGGGGGGWGC